MEAARTPLPMLDTTRLLVRATLAPLPMWMEVAGRCRGTSCPGSVS